MVGGKRGFSGYIHVTAIMLAQTNKAGAERAYGLKLGLQHIRVLFEKGSY